ncbi:MAG TPA: glycosyltransferase [Anaerolineae bacterium]|nr:glycosyltransferase [Anaerolineae bacterium]
MGKNTTVRKRIIFLIDGLGMGGAERLLVIYLQHLNRTRFEPRVCVLQVKQNNPMAAEIEKLGVPIDFVPVKRLADPTAPPRLLGYLRRMRPAVLHTQLEFADTLGGTAAKLLGIPTVSTLHTADAPEKGEKSYRRLKLRWWILRHFPARVIAVSEETRQHHLRVGKLPPQKVITLHNGIDLSRFQPVSPAEIAALRESLGIPAAAPVLVTVAVLRQPKGIQFLLEALPDILQRVPETRYLIVGDGEYREKLENIAAEKNVTDRVIFAGTRRDIPQLLAATDIFVLPTLTEALPTVLAEAMAAEKPIIASHVGGVPEMVDDGQNGLLIPPADPPALTEACLKLLENPQRARAMGKTGQQIVGERFDIQRQVRRLESLYLDICGEKLSES